MPQDFVIAITYNCNSKCRMCHIWQKQSLPVLALVQYQKLPRGIKEINITGGEPFLHPDLVNLVKNLVSKNPEAKIIISSNGFATDLIVKQVKEIIKFKPDLGLAFSLDGIEELHDQIRGVPGGYQKVLKTIQSLQALGIKNIRLAFTAGDYNIDEFFKVYQLSQKLKIEFTLAAVHNAENYFNISDNKINQLKKFKKQFYQLIKSELKSWKIKKWGRAYFAYGLYNFINTGQRILPNYSGIDNIFIDPLGNVYPSDVAGQSMGNLEDFENFSALYNSEQAQKAVALAKNNSDWMMCTARSAFKRHKLRILFWALKNKFLGLKI